MCDTIGNRESDFDLEALFKTDDWRAERDCYNAIKKNGHDVDRIALFDDVRPLIAAVEKKRPSIIFNQVEHFKGVSLYERNIVGLYELLQIPYTGANPSSLMLCKNKAITKEILNYHNVKTPQFYVFPQGSSDTIHFDVPFPCIVKPLRDEASYGIAKNSLVETAALLKDRIAYIHESLGQDAIVEEYIVGRELYVSVIGNTQLSVYPIRELYFPSDSAAPQFATFKVKWNAEYRKKWGIRYGYAEFENDALVKKIERECTHVYRALRIHGCARIDMRVTESGDIYVLEVNPNPSLARHDDFSLSAKKSGIAYEDLINQLMILGLDSFSCNSPCI